jgi:hypothetical protein
MRGRRPVQVCAQTALTARLISRDALSIRRLVNDPGAARAIRKAFNWLIPSEPEVHGSWIADRPATCLLAQLKQRAIVSVADGHFFGRRLLLARSAMRI